MDETKKIDLKNTEVRELNRMLQKRDGNNFNYFNIINPMGAHAIATGLDLSLIHISEPTRPY